MPSRMTRYLSVALPVLGSAILLFSCEHGGAAAAPSEELRMTEYSENLSIVNSQNGRRSYHFVTPLMEGYSQAAEPYREFRKGVEITTYKDDSLSTVDAVLTANYAIYYEKRRLWEAKGDVVVEKSDGKKLFTQQLFWNERTKKIYSNVDSKIVQSGGTDVFIGEGFESDEEFKDWRFRRMKGRMEVDVTPGAQSDSLAAGSPRSEAGSAANVSSGRSAANAPAVGSAPGRPAASSVPGGSSVRSAEPNAVEVSPADRRPSRRRSRSAADAPVPAASAMPDASPAGLRDRPDASDSRLSAPVVLEPLDR